MGACTGPKIWGTLGELTIGMGRADSEFILITEGLYLVAYRFREATTLNDDDEKHKSPCS